MKETEVKIQDSLSAVDMLFEPGLDNLSLATVQNQSVTKEVQPKTELQVSVPQPLPLAQTLPATGDILTVVPPEQKDISRLPQLAPHPLILADRAKALETIQELLSAARSIRREIEAATLEEPICPYQRTLLEYLGPNFVCPTIHDLAFPSDFKPTEAAKQIVEISKNYNNQMLTHLQIMSAEAADMTFPGITSQNLGNAFATLSCGEYVIDKQKAAKHLEFAEIVSNIPTDYIVNNPVIVAQKLIARYLEIHAV